MKNSNPFYQRLIQAILLVLFFTNLTTVQAQAPAIQWQKMLGGAFDEQSYVTQQTADGGYIMAGYTASSNSGDVAGVNKGGYDMWLVKMNALGAIQWQKNIGGSGDEEIYEIQQTTDGGYIVAGMTTSSNSGDVNLTNHGGQDAWIVKLDATGTIVWQKVMGGIGVERAFAVRQTTEGGYIVAASSTSSNSGDVGLNNGTYDSWIIKLSATGVVQWQKLYGGNQDEETYDIQQTTDGGYILAGYTQSSSSGDVTGVLNGAPDYWIVKLNATGAIVWQKNLGGNDNEKAQGIVQAADGGYTVIGFTRSSNSGNVGLNHGSYDTWLIKLDATGTLLWQNTLGGSQDELSLFIQKTADGGYIFPAHTLSSSSGDVTAGRGSSDCWIVKVNELGVIQWQKVMGGAETDEAFSVYPTTDGGYIVSATSSSILSGDVTETNRGNTDIWLVKLFAPCNFTPSVSGNNSLCVGLTSTLTGSTTTGTAVWSSLNPAVATVSATGLVTGISVGTTDINYTVTQGGCSSVAAKIMNITGPPTIVTTVQDAVGATASGIINIESLPQGASSSINNGVLTLDKRLYTGLAAGVYSIKVQFNGCETTKNVTVSTAVLTFDPSKCYRIINKATNKALQVKDASLLNAAQIYQWTPAAVSQQLWQLTKQTDGNFTISSTNSEKMMDIIDNSAAGYCAEGTIIQQFTADGTNSQRWRIEMQPDRSLKIYNATCNKPLRVENSSAADGANVGIKVDFGTESFKWFIVEAQCQPTACITEGSILVERWDNSTAVNTPLRVPIGSPTVTTTQTSTSPVWNVGDNFFARARGYIRPQTTGSYLFNITGDDRAELYLSTSKSPTAASLIAFTNNWTGSIEYTKYPTQTSTAITLTANQLYYFEVRHKEFTSGDFWRVSWQTPTNATWQPITSQFLSKPCTNLFPLVSATNATFSFEARAAGGRAKLQWVTNTSDKTDYFEIERLNAKGDFDVLGRLNTEGGTDLKSYNFTDNDPLEGDNFYRINSVSTTKQTPQYSEVKKVSFGKNDGVNIYPNPANDFISVDLRRYEGKTVSLSLYNSLGLMVKKQTIEKATAAPQQVDIQELSAGTYLVRVQSEGKRDVLRQVAIAK